MNGEGIDIYGTSSAARKIRDIVTDIKMKGFSKIKPFAMGRVESRMAEYAKTHGITLASKSVYMSSHSIAHTFRGSKQRDNMAVSLMDLASFPKSRSRMDLYFDGKAFVYTDYKSKFIIHPNYDIKAYMTKRDLKSLVLPLFTIVLGKNFSMTKNLLSLRLSSHH